MLSVQKAPEALPLLKVLSRSDTRHANSTVENNNGVK